LRFAGLSRSARAEYFARDRADARGDDVAFAFAELAPQLATVLDDALAGRDHVRESRDQIALLGWQDELEQGANDVPQRPLHVVVAFGAHAPPREPRAAIPSRYWVRFWGYCSGKF